MNVFFDNVQLKSIAGYVIQAGLFPNQGLGSRVRVHIILKGDSNSQVPVLPLNAKNELILTTKKTNYSFPDIEYKGNIFEFNNNFAFSIMEFSHFTPNVAVAQSYNIQCDNSEDPTLNDDISVSKGTIAPNETGTNAAPLVGLRSYRNQGGLTAIQMINERCKLGGWFKEIIQQNNDKCVSGSPVDLKFMLNSRVYDCQSTQMGLEYLFYEEFYGLALKLPIRRIWNKNFSEPRSGGQAILEALFQENLSFEYILSDDGKELIDAWGNQNVGAVLGGDKTIEICTVVSRSTKARDFDCRTNIQKPDEPKPDKQEL